MTKNLTHLTLRLPPEIIREVRQVAQESDRSQSAVFRYAIKKGLDVVRVEIEAGQLAVKEQGNF